MRPSPKAEKPGLGGQFGAHQFQGIDGVGRFVPLQFAGVHHQRRHTGHRALDHRQTVLRRHLRRIAMRRPGTGCQTQLIERQRFGDFQRTAQMADVHRVERPAQYANAPRLQARWRSPGLTGRSRPSQTDSCPRNWPSPTTMYFSQVRPSRPTGPRACSLSVEMPISAPNPYSKPSAKHGRGVDHHRRRVDFSHETPGVGPGVR